MDWCRRCHKAEHPGVSCYMAGLGKTPADKRTDGRTFQSIYNKTIFTHCDECCNGDRCDDPSHGSRESCHYCLGSGVIATKTEAPNA